MKLTKNELKELQRKGAAYVKSWKAKGGETTLYRCNCCQNLITTPKPGEQDVAGGGKPYWDSSKICTECGGVNFVIVYPSGKTISRSFDDQPKELVYNG